MSDFRQRILVPVALPLGVLIALLGVAFALSRVLLSVDHTLAVMVALVVAAYVLILALVIERRPRVSSRALAVGTVLGLAAVLGAGMVASVAGPYQAEGAEGEAVAAEELTAIPPGAPGFTSSDVLQYLSAPPELPAGESQIYLQTESLEHNVTFEGVNGEEPIVEGSGPEVNVGTVDLDPGEYTYYCSIAGHRQGGMEGTLTVN